MGNCDNKVKALSSCALDWVPGVGTAKGIYEGIRGQDVITKDNLNGFERTMCFVGAVPLVGNAAKTFTNSEKAIRNISRGAKAAKWADRAYGAYDAYDSATSTYDKK